MTETVRFANDAATRRRLMDGSALAHPAKGHMGMWAEMIQKYSVPGDTVLMMPIEQRLVRPDSPSRRLFKAVSKGL